MKKLILLFFIFSTLYGQGYLRTEDGQIVDETGNNFTFKGMGLGGWLVPEGYMLKMSSFANSPTEIKSKIIDLVGEENSDAFFEAYRANFITKADIDSMAAAGFNSVRLPMHYELMTPRDQPFVYIEKGFAYIDSLLAWCRPHNIYVIPDLHCAPGGQNAAPISDYDPAYPSLWESETNKLRTIDLWRHIALRYKDEPLIGGYDLLNEPNWDLPPNNQPLRDLYINITNAIRESDSNHIIYVEGNWYATDMTGLTPPWDFNMTYSFHKYWSTVAQSSIASYLSIRSNYNVPLWMSESGENSNAWFSEFVSLLNENNLGWHWWTWKKLNAIAVFASSPIAPQYQVLLNYWNGSGPRPTVDYANTALQLQAGNLKLQNCELKKGVFDAIFRQPYDNTAIPFRQHDIPGRIFFTDYDMGNHNIAYHDNNYENNGSGSYNNGWSYRNDGVDIGPCSDQITNGFDVGWIDSGDWLKFTVNIQDSSLYEANIRIAANESGGKIVLYLDDTQLTNLIDVPVTGGWQNWQTLRVENIYLPAGKHEVIFRFYFGGFNVNFVDFNKLVGIGEDESTPAKFYLSQNFPNPISKNSDATNGTTTVNYSIPKTGYYTLAIYNMLGQKVKTLFNKKYSPGSYSIDFSTTQFASGVYLLRFSGNKINLVRKISVIK